MLSKIYQEFRSVHISILYKRGYSVIKQKVFERDLSRVWYAWKFNYNVIQFTWIFEIRNIVLNFCRFILVILFHFEAYRRLINDVWSRFTRILLLETIKYLIELILIHSVTFHRAFRIYTQCLLRSTEINQKLSANQ